MIDEGYTKFAVDWRVSGPLDSELIGDLPRWRKRLYEAGLIGQYDDIGIGYGNISARSRSAGLFVISGTQTGHLADLSAAHFSQVTQYDLLANRVACRGPVQASSEAMTHATIYSLDPAINAVVHIHSAEMWVRLKGSLPTTSADVAYGTPEMAKEFARLYRETEFAETGIAVMAGHEEGLISTGADLQEAASRLLALVKP